MRLLTYTVAPEQEGWPLRRLLRQELRISGSFLSRLKWRPGAILLNGQPARVYGSQGQQRSAVLSMKLGEIRLIENEMGEPPTLLLDDVFSELDVRRRSALLKSTEGVQTLITCTDRQDAADAHADAFLRVSQGEDGKACLSPA